MDDPKTIAAESEADTRAKRIDPVLKQAGWDVIDTAFTRREEIAPGRILNGGRRSTPMQCDYVLR